MISPAITSLSDHDRSQQVALFLTSLAALIAAVMMYFYFTKNVVKKDKCAPPVAPAGILHTIQQISGPRAPWFLSDMVKETGSDIFRLRLPIPGGMYVVGDPAVVREIFLDKTSDKSQDLGKGFSRVVGTHSMVTYNNGEKWHKARKGTSPAFSSNEVNRMNSICTQQVQNWIRNTLEQSIENNESFDPSEEMVKITFSVILEAAFEYTASTDDEYEQFSKDVELAMREFVFKPIADPLRNFYGFFFSSEYREALKANKRLQAFAFKVLETYRNKKDEDKSPNNTVIKLIANNKNFADDMRRIAEVLIMLIAGHDTTGYTLGSTLFLLAKHPQVSEKLQSELLCMDADKMPQSKYMRHVFMESNRLLPVAAI